LEANKLDIIDAFRETAMPIYEYCCSECGFQKEHLQKLSDTPLTDCPACGKSGYKKMLTAAGFHLKGSGWYATDFKSSKSASKADGGSTDTAAPACGAGACPACTT
jgi:putative FmdB family regulatory protein